LGSPDYPTFACRTSPDKAARTFRSIPDAPSEVGVDNLAPSPRLDASWCASSKATCPSARMILRLSKPRQDHPWECYRQPKHQTERSWSDGAIARIEADFSRSADTHLVALPFLAPETDGTIARYWLRAAQETTRCPPLSPSLSPRAPRGPFFGRAGYAGSTVLPRASLLSGWAPRGPSGPLPLQVCTSSAAESCLPLLAPPRKSAGLFR
jgi:hypothetical protein